MNRSTTKKENIFLILFAIIGLILAIVNNLFSLPIALLSLPITLFIDGFFIAFALIFAIKGKNIKSYLTARFIVAYIFLLIAYEIAVFVISKLSVIPSNIFVEISLEYVGKFIVFGVILLCLTKIHSVDTNIFTKKFILILGVGFVASLIMRAAMFSAFEFSYYEKIANIPETAPIWDYLSAVDTPVIVEIIPDVFSWLIPAIYGISAYFKD